MAPCYKLTYFDGRGAAEPIRFLLSYGKKEFEDVRIKMEDWPAIKESMPFGQLPVLEHNGKRINQSVSIARYLAREFNLAGSNNWENLEIDAIVDTIGDFRKKFFDITFYEKDENVKKEKFKVFLEDNVPYFFKKLEDIAKANNGHLALGKLTWADLVFVAGNETINSVAKTDFLADYPNLQQVEKNVTSIPQIKQWISSRPKSDF